jgi:hypothetical protein
MTAIVSALLLLSCSVGTASQYGRGVMERVVKTRQAGLTAYNLPATLPVVDGYIAVMNCNDIGQVWSVNGEKMLASDCAGSQATRNWMAWNNIPIEVDYLTALRWNTVGRGKQAEICRGVN